MAGLVFGKLFFPNEDPLTATLNAFGIYFVGFLARPVGAFIFGHYGDRIGRKSTLIALARSTLAATRPGKLCPQQVTRGRPIHSASLAVVWAL
jgi:MFS family permease